MTARHVDKSAGGHLVDSRRRHRTDELLKLKFLNSLTELLYCCSFSTFSCCKLGVRGTHNSFHESCVGEVKKYTTLRYCRSTVLYTGYIIVTTIPHYRSTVPVGQRYNTGTQGPGPLSAAGGPTHNRTELNSEYEFQLPWPNCSSLESQPILGIQSLDP